MFLFISTSEIVFLLFAVLMLFGTDKLPGIARMAAKAIKTVKNASNDLKSEISNATIDDSIMNDAKNSMTEIKNSIQETVSRKK
ncbi:MAG: Sec-independent protein translocase protein TatA [Owenweeksia sp. TMED14]|nr:MAG: Sec-independent protein translocase protein TatA [Owenweeksia sp. TMED14]